MASLEMLTPLLGGVDESAYVLYGAAACVASILFVMWLFLGRAPRRLRAYRRAYQLLEEGLGERPLATISQISERARRSPHWQALLNELEGECYRTAAAGSLKIKEF